MTYYVLKVLRTNKDIITNKTLYFVCFCLSNKMYLKLVFRHHTRAVYFTIVHNMANLR